MIVPTKSVKCYGNNKPWVTKELKVHLNNKKKALSGTDRHELKLAQKKLKKNLIHAEISTNISLKTNLTPGM